MNKRFVTNNAVVDEVFEQIAQSEPGAMNVDEPALLADLVFDRKQAKITFGKSHDVAIMTAEQLTHM